MGNISNGEISIRGAAGPYTVVAQNFAPGTTAADIESVMQPVGGDMMSCRLAASNPTVIAEMVFIDKQGADNVIATFNNKKADGRLLYVYMKQSSGETSTAPVEPAPAKREPIAREAQDLNAEAEMEVDQDLETAGYRDDRMRREEYARSGSDNRSSGPRYDDRRAEPTYSDGRYGFGGTPQGPRYGDRRGDGWRGDGRMYSDNMRRSGPRGGW